MVSGPKRKPIKERFFNLIHKTPYCWEWIGSRYKNGYGSFGIGIWREGTFKNTYAHRVSYELHKGKIPTGMCVLHRCDNPPCVNPKHLFIGTHADNVRDKVLKKRHDFGEKNARAILKESDVIKIRNLFKSGIKRKEIFNMYSDLVKPDCIESIIRRDNWKHI